MDGVHIVNGGMGGIDVETRETAGTGAAADGHSSHSASAATMDGMSVCLLCSGSG